VKAQSLLWWIYEIVVHLVSLVWKTWSEKDVERVCCGNFRIENELDNNAVEYNFKRFPEVMLKVEDAKFQMLEDMPFLWRAAFHY
jgi:hypothetical protein